MKAVASFYSTMESCLHVDTQCAFVLFKCVCVCVASTRPSGVPGCESVCLCSDLVTYGHGFGSGYCR